MTIALRPHWRNHCTPFDMKVPADPIPAPGINWQEAFDQELFVVHEDAEDCLNADQTWGPYGPDGTYKPGGSGIRFAYGAEDPDALVVADRAIRNRALKYNLAHWCREAGYAWYLSDMTRELKAPRRVAALADFQRSTWALPDAYDGPGNNPRTVAFMELLASQTPGRALDAVRIDEPRAIGWLQWGEAMALKVSPQREHTFAQRLVDLTLAAVIPETGQIVRGPHSGIDQGDIFYVFQSTIWWMGTLALCMRLGRPIPPAVFTYAEKVHALPVVDYYGSPTMPAFVRSEGGQLIPGTGPEQQGDPSIGWYEELCAVLYKLTGDTKYVSWSCKFGVGATLTAAATLDQKRAALAAITNLQARKQTVLLRGVLTA
jgi:hypothetical protein